MMIESFNEGTRLWFNIGDYTGRKLINYWLVRNEWYPESAKVLVRVGKYISGSEIKKMRWNLERAVETNKDPKMVKEILAIL